HVPRGGAQDRFRVVAQRDDCHACAGRKAARKRFPFHEDGLDVPDDEFSQSHTSSLVRRRGLYRAGAGNAPPASDLDTLTGRAKWRVSIIVASPATCYLGPTPSETPRDPRPCPAD